MKKAILLSIISIGISFFSCKKSSTPAPATSQSSSGTPYCFLTVLRSFSYSSGSLVFNSNSAYAEFRSDLNNISTDMQIGSVSIGGKSLKFLPGSKTYSDTTYALSIIPTTWQIVGAGPIPSYTYTNNDSLPGYTDYVSLPDTIYKNQALNLQINGISGANSIEVSFYNSSVSNTIYKMKSTGISSNNTFTFSVSDLSPLPIGPSSPTLIIVSVFKDNYQHPSNVTFNFKNQLEVNKQVYIK
jgi:hypothetical protein